ncbi:probable calcium-binding protein CML48 isoform X2 [Andrographis paniculata]|uniref:probable calcium-binding protein CML48 isoform X2 n=1 Tax=Andrographis paniculata TaxID=175694 RepID=UPI0021E77745|nr:probable calcium-binding protein CML48 isoform X2 [Andrographis paniculata]
MASYKPSAPPAPEAEPDQPRVGYPYHPPPPTTAPHSSSPYAPISGTFGTYPPPHGGYGNYYQQDVVHSSFPPGTHPDVIRSFQMVDRNRNGYVEETELREALTWNYREFSLRTLRLLVFLFRNPNQSSATIGPKEFAEIWSCLGHWRAIFERFDRDRSGKIDARELRDALYSLGYALPPSVLQVLMLRYDDGTGRRVELNFDSFVECGLIVKGLTEKFKEKDKRYTGSATLSYDTFMSMVIPFIVSD